MTYATNLWYAALWAEDLAEGALQSRTICEQPIVFFRGPEGEPVALEDRCAHRFIPLSMGQLCDGAASVECPYHGLRFGTDGACVLNPHGSGRIPATLAVRSYPVVERHTMLWIWMGTDEAGPGSRSPTSRTSIPVHPACCRSGTGWRWMSTTNW